MTKENWEGVTARYLTDAEQADFAAAPLPADFDQAAYSAQWKDLGGRIKAALPMDPASPQAQAFAAEWRALLAPFMAVATPAMMAGTTRMYETMDEWQGEADPGFDAEVFGFIQAAMKAKG